MQFITKWVIAGTIGLGSVIAVGESSRPDPSNTQPRNQPATEVSHDQVQRDIDMTQQMSTPNAVTDSPYHRADGQLTRAQSDAYVGALEQHQAAIDKMLAVPGR